MTELYEAENQNENLILQFDAERITKIIEFCRSFVKCVGFCRGAASSVRRLNFTSPE